ncbi:MAG: molybdenum cofactor biosynthesis protein MoaE [Acidimicrobiales bacterium]
MSTGSPEASGFHGRSPAPPAAPVPSVRAPAVGPVAAPAVGPVLGPVPAGPPSRDWLGLGTDPLPVTDALAWASRPDCGAVVLFSGTVRDNAPGRPGVTALEYEAYDAEVVPRLAAIAAEARRRWPTTGRLALLHRSGRLAVGETSVVVVASSPHRHEAFAAARFCIDTLKATVPIWKRETWEGGEDWSACAFPLAEVPATDAPEVEAS